MSLGRRTLLRSKRLIRLSGQAASPDTLLSLHSGGLTCNQWRKLKNLWSPGKTLFCPSCFGEKNDGFLAQQAHRGGPTCIARFPQGAPDRLASMDLDLLLLCGQFKSALVDHVGIVKASNLAESEASLFKFCLPSLYLSFLLHPTPK